MTPRGKLAYTGGRLSAVATRPLCLFAANNYLAPATAEGLAVVFLASSFAVIAIAADPHRRYYARLFATETRFNGVAFYLYAASLFLMLVIGAVVVFGISLRFAGSLQLASVAIAYFASERFADEVQRVRIFDRRLDEWGRFALWRGLLQVGALLVLVLAMRESTPAWLIVSVLAIANFALFIPQLSPSFLRNLLRIRWRAVVWLVGRSWRLLFQSWPIWVTAQLTSAFGYLDRAVALVLDKATLPLFMLVVQCFSVVQLTVDFYYMSHHRRDFLEGGIGLLEAHRSRRYIYSFFGGLAAGLLACIAVLTLSRNGAEFPLIYVAAIACLQTSVAISLVPREMLYWSHNLKGILQVEIVFWALFMVIAVAGWQLHLPVAMLFTLIAACAMVRLAHFFRLAARVSPAGPGSGAVA